MSWIVPVKCIGPPSRLGMAVNSFLRPSQEKHAVPNLPLFDKNTPYFSSFDISGNLNAEVRIQGNPELITVQWLRLGNRQFENYLR